ncbi:MAG: retropepsin-like aspartic protease [Nonlabens sp.]
MALKKLLTQQGYTPHRFRIAKKTGHIITKARINGREGRFIVDTGASASCINQELYKEFVLQTEYIDREIGTASGSMKPRVSHGNHLELGEWKDEDTTLLTMDMSFINNALKAVGMRSVQGLLGADVLIESKAILDYGGKLLYLKI